MDSKDFYAESLKLKGKGLGMCKQIGLFLGLTARKDTDFDFLVSKFIDLEAGPSLKPGTYVLNGIVYDLKQNKEIYIFQIHTENAN